MEEQTKLDILAVIKSSQVQGVSVRRSCLILAIAHRRVIRWQKQARQGESLANLKPGSTEPLHRVLPEEIDRIVAMAKSQEYVDLSHRILAVTACDKGLFQASFSTVYRVLKERNMMTARGPGGAHNGNSKAPIRKDLSGPNQRWCWDISYLMTFQKGVYLYLYLLLDEWSRKALQWRISWQQTAEESRLLLEGGLVEQNILDLPEDQRPELINDRGRQMKAKPIQKLCEHHGMPQMFARPRTPNDNPFIESAFSTVKRAPAYPGRFLDDDQAVTYFTRYFTWYDTEHYHSGIDYVTPEQAHQGLRQKIVDQRNSKKLSQRRRRREENQRRQSGKTRQTITQK
jgi:putative transposase